MVRKLARREIKKRGCVFCLNVVHENCKFENGIYFEAGDYCTFDRCPYRVLDDVGHYDEYDA